MVRIKKVHKIKAGKFYVTADKFYMTMVSKPFYEVNCMVDKEGNRVDDFTKAHKVEIVDDYGYCRWYQAKHLIFHKFEIV